jgi:hypothetical protein
MKMIATRKLGLAALALCVAVAFAPVFAQTAQAANVIRISQAYGGGGGSSGIYTQDFVELFNSSMSPVDVSGWVIEYGSNAGNWGSASTNYFTLPTGTSIQGCGYLLVACGTVGAGGVTVPGADFYTTNMSMSASNGRVGIFNALNANVVCGSETAGTLVDKVAWGTTAICAEGTLVVIASGQAVVRNGGGMVDTDDNSADFTPDSNPVPRSSQSPLNPLCTVTPTQPHTWGSVKMLYR